MSTDRIWLPILVLLGVILAGLISVRGEILALALPLVVFIGAGFLFAPLALHIEIERTLSAHTIKPGQPVEVKVRVRNPGEVIYKAVLSDEVPYGLTRTEGNTSWLLTLKKGEQAEFCYSVTGERGSYTFQTMSVSITDPFSLFSLSRGIQVTSELHVFPKTFPLRPVLIRPPQTRGFAGPIPSRQAGSGVDFFGIRAYQIGDNRRRINWRVSARYVDELFTNEFEMSRIADVGLILDARQKRDVNYGNLHFFNYSVQATASLSEVFLHEGNRVSLTIYGNGIQRVYPGYGKVQQSRILQLLSGTTTGQNFALEHLNYLPIQMFPSHSQIVLISPLGSGDVNMLYRLRSSGYALLVVSPDPVAYEAQLYPPSDRLEQARRAANIERRVVLLSLRKAGIQVVDWQVDQDLDPLLQKAIRQQPFFPRSLNGGGR